MVLEPDLHHNLTELISLARFVNSLLELCLPINTTSLVFASIISPNVGHWSIGRGFGLVEGVKTYLSAPTLLKMDSNVVIAMLSGFVQSSVTTSLGLLSSQFLTVVR
jgi:hypothetical protein